MDVKDIIYIVGGMVTVIGSHFKLKNENDLTANNLLNHIRNHDKLEQRVTEHERSIDGRLQKIEQKIDDKHSILNGKLDDLKDWLMDKFK